MLEDADGNFYYHAYYLRQFDNIFNTFKSYATDVLILEVDKETGETTDISNRHISKDWYNTNLPYDEETNGVNQDSLQANWHSYLALSDLDKEYVVTGTFRVNMLSITEDVMYQELTNNGVSLGTNPSNSYNLTLP